MSRQLGGKKHMNFNLFSKQNQDAHPLSYDLTIAGIFILFGTLSRFFLVGWEIQPFPNFELIMVLTFVSLFLIRPSLVFTIPLFSMIISDLLLGNPVLIGSSMNRIVLFTYTGFLIISFIFLKTKNKSHHTLSAINLKSVGLCVGIGMISTLVFDVWTNAGWWYLMFPHTIESFTSVFIAGIPFMIYHQLSTVISFLTVAIPIGYLLTNSYQISLPKKQFNLEKIPFIAVTTSLILLSFSGSAMAIPDQTDIWLEDSTETSVSITVKGSTWEFSDQIILTQQTSVLDVLNSMAKRNEFTVDTTYDTSLDASLVNSINKDINGENQCYWQYIVNGEMPMTGSDNTMVSNGDIIIWHFSQFR